MKYYDDPFKDWGSPEDRVKRWAADKGHALRKVVEHAIQDTLSVLESSFFLPHALRGTKRISAYSSDHEIVMKEPGLVVSVPVGYDMK